MNQKAWRVGPGEVSFRGVVFPWDCDMFGHLNNKNYLGFYDQAGWHVLLALNYSPGRSRAEGLGLADVGQNIAFRRELRAGDLIIVRSHMIRVGETSLTILHRMYDAENESLVSTLESTTVFVDLSTKTKTPIPSTIRATAMSWQNAEGAREA